MDDDFVITWNLKGPKRMKTRKELNALLTANSNSSKDSSRAKSPKNLSTSSLIKKFTHCSSSSDENGDGQKYYFAANKRVIRKYGLVFF